MYLLQGFRKLLLLAMVLLAFIVSCPTVHAQSFNATEDTQIFIAGFNAFQKQDYRTAADRMDTIVRQHPSSQLYDTALFWLARAHFKLGNKQEAGRYMAQFIRQYPNSPLRSSVEEDLAALAGEYAGTAVAAAAPPPAAVAPPAPSAASPSAVTATPSMPSAPQPATQESQPAALQAPPQAQAAPASPPVVVTPPSAVAAPPAPPAGATTAVAGKVPREKSPDRQVSRQAGRSERLRARAIEEYKQVIERHPGTPAAAAASEKLRSLGVIHAAAQPAQRPLSDAVSAKVLAFQVAQYARGDLTVDSTPSAAPAGEKAIVPFTVLNAGNGPDSFLLESAFPSEFSPRFSSQARPDEPVGSTPVMGPGESFKGVLTLTLPLSLVDGQVSRYSVKAVSTANPEASVTREISLTTSAPLLRAVVASDKTEVAPGERISYRISLLNIGSAPARNVRLGIVCSPQYDLLEMRGASLQAGDRSELAANGLQVASGENREFTVSFQVKDDAPARQELFCRADVLNGDLKTRDTFLSGMAAVRAVSGVSLSGKPGPQKVIPGQTVSLPLVVANHGNFRDTFSLRPVLPDGLKGEYFLDQNRDGIHQSGEPRVSSVGPLSPREEAAIIFQLVTPAGSQDRTELTAGTTVESESDRTRKASSMVRLVFSRPLVELLVASGQGNLLPGDISSLALNCVNRGSNLAKTLEVRTTLPPQLEMLSADPPPLSSQDGIVTWRFSELGAGEQRPVRLVFRIRTGVPAGTGIQVQNAITYEDQLGNRY